MFLLCSALLHPMDDRPRGTFEDRFADLAGAMLRALERRRDRAHARAADLYRQDWQGGMDGARRAAHDRWREIHADYERALDGVHRAMVFVRHAGELLARLRRDRARGRDGG
jgi:hypothetical protein